VQTCLRHSSLSVGLYGHGLSRSVCGRTRSCPQVGASLKRLMPGSSHRGGEGGVEVAGERVVELPGDGHGLLAHVAAVGGGAEVTVSSPRTPVFGSPDVRDVGGRR
jgi:hypothetical protein